MNRQYEVRKEVAIGLNSCGILLSFLAGFLFGSGEYLLGSIVTALYIATDNIGGRLWFWVLENIKR
jgi:hypothetical protein